MEIDTKMTVECDEDIPLTEEEQFDLLAMRRKVMFNVRCKFFSDGFAEIGEKRICNFRL